MNEDGVLFGKFRTGGVDHEATGPNLGIEFLRIFGDLLTLATFLACSKCKWWAVMNNACVDQNHQKPMPLRPWKWPLRPPYCAHWAYLASRGLLPDVRTRLLAAQFSIPFALSASRLALAYDKVHIISDEAISTNTRRINSTVKPLYFGKFRANFFFQSREFPEL